jgi:hypothetical protein
MQIVGARSAKSGRSILALRYVVDADDLSVKGTNTSKKFTPQELFKEIETLDAVDLGRYVRIDEGALADAAKKLRGLY